MRVEANRVVLCAVLNLLRAKKTHRPTPSNAIGAACSKKSHLAIDNPLRRSKGTEQAATI
jgi:hypothetical protein